jgi:hypothetical protein
VLLLGRRRGYDRVAEVMIRLYKSPSEFVPGVLTWEAVGHGATSGTVTSPTVSAYAASAEGIFAEALGILAAGVAESDEAYR